MLPLTVNSITLSSSRPSETASSSKRFETLGLGYLGMLVEVVVVIGRGSYNRVCLAGLGEIDIGVGWRHGRVCRAS